MPTSLPKPHEFFQLDVASRGDLINSYIGEITLNNEPSNSDLIDGFKQSHVVNQYVPYHYEQREKSIEDKLASKTKWELYLKNEFKKINEEYKPIILEKIKANIAHMDGLTRPKSLFEIVGAKELAIAQKHNRSITEKMGHLFENYAVVSPVVFSPEDHYGITIQGVDFIAFINNEITYCQMKTNKNTLTGSQVPRTKEELLVFEKSWFVSAIDSYAPWSLSSLHGIDRIAGNEFWSIVNIPYELVIESVTTLILEIENFVYPR